MPFIDVKIFEQRLTAESERALVAELTDAVVRVFGDDIRAQTWVVLDGVDPRRWGIGGTPSGG